jgi:DMSO/TMAO reductase YedYZ heme-binding membrane subunit
MAVKFLGIGSWKWLHNLSYVIFYLVGFHAIHNLFITPVSAGHLFRYAFLIMLFLVPILQLSAFLKIVRSNRKRLDDKRNK